MKGLILAGGDGRRLLPMTHSTPKSLIPIANRPTIFYALDQLTKVGVRDIGIVYKDPEVCRVLRANEHQWKDIRLTFIDQPIALGLAHGIKTAKNFLSDSRFIMYLGDNLIEDGLSAFGKKDEDKVLFKQVNDPRAFGVVELNKDRTIKSLAEKPDRPKTNYALVGAYLLGPEIHRAIDNITPSKRGELEITDALLWLIKNDFAIIGEEVKGWWLDMGKKDSLLDANRKILQYPTDMKPKLVKNSKIGEPTSLDDCTVIDSEIGPNVSIGKGALIKGSYIENSIIFRETRIENTHLKQSVVGEKCQISGDINMGLSVTLGDHSEIYV